MNFGLNKIDTDIRRKLQEETKDGIIHRKSEVVIQTDEEKNKDRTFEKIMFNEENNGHKKKKEIDKKEEKEMKVKVKISSDSKSDFRGSFLDVMK